MIDETTPRLGAPKARRFTEQTAPQAPPRLTKREREVLKLLCLGLSDKLIAARLKLSYGGIRRHVDSLLRKYAVNSARELLARELVAAYLALGQR